MMMMLKNLIVLLIILLCTNQSFAESCPSIGDIKKQIFHGWQAYDSDKQRLVSIQRLSTFKKQASKFLFAEWVEKGQNLSGHCYYSDGHGSFLEVFLAKEKVMPLNSRGYWYPVSGYMHCAAGANKCQFNQLA
jgi:hypothetical protein